MKLEEVSPIGMVKNRNTEAHKALSTRTAAQPADQEKEAFIAAIKAATIYVAIVVHVADAGDALGSLAILADFIRNWALPESFSGYVIVRPAAAARPSSKGGLNIIVLAKAIGSIPATSITLPDDQSDSEAVAFYNGSVGIKTDFIARIDELCNDALLIAMVGKSSVIPIWMPMTFVPRR